MPTTAQTVPYALGDAAHLRAAGTAGLAAPPSTEALLLAARVHAVYAATRVTDSLVPDGSVARQLQPAIRDYVAARRDEGAAPERVLVELKTMRTARWSPVWHAWRRVHDEALRGHLMRWFVEEYFPARARRAD